MRRQGPREHRHRRGSQRQCRQSPLHVWGVRRRGQPEAGWRDGIRDRLDHQGFDRADPGRHGRARRSRDERSGSKIPAPSVKVPAYEGKPITLLDLATYTSGLPISPDNFIGPNYTVDEFYTFLSGYTPKYQPGTHYEYA